MRYKIILLICLCASCTVYSQIPITIGKHMPDISGSFYQKDKTVTFRFSDFKGKLVVFDFWGVNCLPCIRSFKKLDSLQQQFKNQIQIILVTSSSKKEIDSIFSKRLTRSQIYRLPDLPLITSDTLFHKIFPHKLIPHVVWADQDGKVCNITDDAFLNEENLQGLLENKFLKFPEKRDLLDYNPDQPMLPQISNNPEGRVLYYSAILGWIEGFWGGTSRMNFDSINQTVRLTRGLHSILTLYADALSEFKCYCDPYKHAYFDFGKRVILEINDSSRYFFNPQGNISFEQWQQKNCFGYEAVLPLDEKTNIYGKMLTDLNLFFQIKGRLEKRKMKCMALIRKTNEDKIKYSGTKDLSLGRFFFDTSGNFHIYGSIISHLTDKLSEFNQDKDYVFVDNTGYEGLIEMDIESPLNDLTRLRKELELKYDLDLIEVEQEVLVMVITEKNFKKYSKE